MKKGMVWTLRIVDIVAALILFVLAAVLGVIQFRMILAGDAILYENVLGQTFRLVFRFLGMVFIGVSAVLSPIALWKKGSLLAVALSGIFGSLIFAVFSAFYYDWYIALGLIVLLLLLVAPHLISVFNDRLLQNEN